MYMYMYMYMYIHHTCITPHGVPATYRETQLLHSFFELRLLVPTKQRRLDQGPQGEKSWEQSENHTSNQLYLICETKL